VQDSNATLPVLGYVKIQAEGEAVTISATDLRISMTWHVPADVEQKGACCLPHKKLLGLVKLTGGGSISLDDSGEGVSVRAVGLDYRLTALAARNFPSLPSRPAQLHAADAADLRALIDTTLHAASTDEERAHLCGGHLVSDDDSATMEATDGHRLAVAPRQIKIGALDLTIPTRGLKAIRALLDKADRTRIGEHKGTVTVVTDRASVSVREVDQQSFRFPPVSHIITHSQRQIIVETAPLVAAFKRALVVADASEQVRMSIGLAELQVIVDCEESKGRESVAISNPGVVDLTIGVNAGFMLDALARSGARVRICVDGPLDPIEIRPVDTETLFLLMPCRMDGEEKRSAGAGEDTETLPAPGTEGVVSQADKSQDAALAVLEGGK
jgi:DNA polymerase-3 subunit beta